MVVWLGNVTFPVFMTIYSYSNFSLCSSFSFQNHPFLDVVLYQID